MFEKRLQNDPRRNVDVVTVSLKCNCIIVPFSETRDIQKSVFAAAGQAQRKTQCLGTRQQWRNRLVNNANRFRICCKAKPRCFLDKSYLHAAVILVD